MKKGICLLLSFLFLLVSCAGGNADTVSTPAPVTTPVTTPGTTPVTTPGATVPPPISDIYTAAPTESGSAPPTPSIVGADRFVCHYTVQDRERMNADLDELERLVSVGTDYESFEALYRRVTETELVNLVTQSYAANLEYTMQTDSAALEANYLEMQEHLGSVRGRLAALYESVWCSPFREAFYDGWTDAEIAEVRAMAEIYTEEFVALQNAYHEMVLESHSMSYTDDALPALYLRVAEVNRQMAALAGFESYPEYAYSRVYSRDYSPKEAEDFRRLVKEQIVPLYFAVMDKLIGDVALINQSAAHLAAYYAFYLNDRTGGAMKGYLDDFILLSGTGSSLDVAYKTMLEEENLLLAGNSQTTLPTAFTVYLPLYDTPVMYFGTAYQNLMTFVHEFGHYLSFDTHGIEAMGISFDLAETQSQGLEWLFLSTLDTLSAGKNDGIGAISRFLVGNEFAAILKTVIEATIIDEFESYVYTHPSVTVPELDAVYRDICDSYGGYDALRALFGYAPELYWRLVCIETPCYYISYAASALPALYIGAVAFSDGFYAAMELYLDVTCRNTGDFLDVLSRSAVGSPFCMDTYETIVDIFSSYLRIQ